MAINHYLLITDGGESGREPSEKFVGAMLVSASRSVGNRFNLKNRTVLAEGVIWVRLHALLGFAYLTAGRCGCMFIDFS